MLKKNKSFESKSWNNISILLFAGIMVFTFACTNKTADATASNSTNVPATTMPGKQEAFTIKVIDSAPKSPRKEMTGSIDGVAVTVNYGSPAVKGRSILNNLIPYGKVWRSGANEATTIEFSKDVKVEGKSLKAGKYGFFTLNNEGSTEVIFNSVHDQWGAYDFNAQKNVLSVIVRPSVSAAHVESMDFKIVNNTVMLVWEKVAIPFEVEAA